jgi:pantoate--beta-alanine ligase
LGAWHFLFSLQLEPIITLPMQTVKTHKALSDSINGFKAKGKVIAFVPTMGALHEGHLRLIENARASADVVVCSIFVNPTQFGENEDFGTYPRDEAKDLRLLEENAVDIVYLPSVAEIYPEGDNEFSDIEVSNGDILEGEFRPDFFGGVARVVAILFEKVQPHKAFFGEKDYQQLHVVQHLASSFGMPVQVIGVPTARAADGLALSSRNAYLTDEERAIAPTLHEALSQVKRDVQDGANVQDACDLAKEKILLAGFESVDYLQVRDAKTLATNITNSPRVLVAATLGKTRLIDNI